jgi:regulator of cell morphogenesis and NO signaling
MSALATDTSLVTLVGDRPARARILERLGIDCGREPGRTLEEACDDHGLDVETVVRMLDVAVDTVPAEGDPEWLSVSLPALIDHIQSTHHDYLRRALPRLSTQLEEATRSLGEESAQWLGQVQAAFQTLKADLTAGLRQEEEYLFPALRTVAEGRVLPDGSTPEPKMLREMADRHDATKTMLEDLRSLTDGYQAPEDAGRAVREVLSRLHELEVDLRRHLHEELHILFPHARSLL